ncbi:M2 family metallopeptidase [Criblamydia sequanensis]|uniref:Oligopeptidase n=1 Tax=Candidatus Criblamydia sequanensis CRIB-18 TaxID=1437425 RepID=A0A090CZQ9_9BACT|nr:M2 family metallopeptidase [Criblamydia sequanensis]CDR34642.1 Oligopeptidase [Criblamydia sequanensis CRIB-18]
MESFIKKHVEKIEPLEQKRNLAWWNLATTGKEVFEEELKELEKEIKLIYSNQEDFLFLKEKEGSLKDPLLERQRKLLYLRYAENQIPKELIDQIVALETEIESIYVNFRPTVEGKSLSNNELKSILVNSLNTEERKKVWEASKEIGQKVEDKVLKLIKLRNRSAKALGYDNYYSMRLHLQEIDEKWLFEWLDHLDEKMRGPFSSYKAGLDEKLSQRYGISVSELRPWHYFDPFFQEAPDTASNLDSYYKDKDVAGISETYYRAIDLPVEDILKRSDLYERENKNQHAFCNCIDRKQDIRILCNLKDNEYWMCTELHELGHAVYDKYIDPGLPYLLRTFAHTNMTEAIAMLFGRLSKNQDWISTFVDSGISSNTVSRINENLLVFSRWAMVMIYFEKALYEENEKSLNKTWWTLVEKFQNITINKDRDSPDWAAKLHLACAPVYYQNYLIGEAIASQIQHYVLKNGASLMNATLGNQLKKLFVLGAKKNWQETLKEFTKEDLTASYLLSDISI